MTTREGSLLMKRGYDRFNSNRLDEALDAYEQVIALEPERATAWERRSMVLWRMGRLDEALQSCQRAIELAPTMKDGWSRLAGLFAELKRYEEALAAYDRWLELEADVWIYRSKAELLQKLGRYEEALAALEKALEGQSYDMVSIHLQKAKVLGEMGLEERALAAFNRAIMLEPSNSRLWEIKGEFLRARGRTTEAEQAFKKAREIYEQTWGKYEKYFSDDYDGEFEEEEEEDEEDEEDEEF
ncbi:MAG TPA: tetratricopeptide repeat protein [Ktedonobacterales bacterium]|jgi:tetratricopeptide (TPR) repeat protein